MIYLPFIAVGVAVILWFVGPLLLSGIFYTVCAALMLGGIWLAGMALLYVVPVIIGWAFLAGTALFGWALIAINKKKEK